MKNMIGIFSLLLLAENLMAEIAAEKLIRQIVDSRSTSNSTFFINLASKSSKGVPFLADFEISVLDACLTAKIQKKVLVPNLSILKSRDEYQKKLQAFSNNVSEFTSAGYGKIETELVQLVWDHNTIQSYSSMMGARISEDTRQAGEVVFDPRLLGLSHHLLLFDTMDRHLLLPGIVWKFTEDTQNLIESIQLQGDYKLRNESGTIKLWLNRKNKVQVVKCATIFGDESSVTESKYSEKVSDVFPQLVEQKVFSAGKLLKTRQINLVRIEDAKISCTGFKSMNLPIGEQIHNVSKTKIIGYWDGEKISPTPIEPSLTADDLAPPPPNYRWLWALLFVLAAIAGYIGLRRLRTRSQ
jgi:hypothetical protein